MPSSYSDRNNRNGGSRGQSRGNGGGRPSGRSYSKDSRNKQREGRNENRGYRSRGSEGEDNREYRSSDRRNSGGKGYGSRDGVKKNNYRSRDDDRRGGAPRKHAQRAGSQRKHDHFNGPSREGFREERIARRANEPEFPKDLDVKDLDPLVLQDLRVLSNDNADAVAKHLIMAATWMAEDPQLALRHARAAKDRAGRVAVVRESAGIAAYHAGEWKEALSELRAARRMSGSNNMIAVMADSERGLGHPEKAIELAREIDQSELDEDTRIELAIVLAGARMDLGQIDSALVTLERANPDKDKVDPENARLSYAYADALQENGRLDEAREWFAHADRQDEDGLLDADERLKELH